MRVRYGSYVVVVFLWFISVGTIGASISATENKFEIYAKFLDEIIYKCEAKASLCNSFSKTIQRDAALACMKSAYYKTFKQELITEMSKQNIKCCPHKIKYFLNQQFIDIVRPGSGPPTRIS